MNGAMNIDEWRAGENQNPLPDGAGQTHFVPLNLVPVEQANEGLPDPGVDVPPEDDDEDDETKAMVVGVERRYLTSLGCDHTRLGSMQVRSVGARHRQLRSFERLLHKAADRVVRREAKEVKRAVLATDGDPTNLQERLAVFYSTFAEVVFRAMHPVLQSYAKVVYALAANEVDFEQEMTERSELFVREYSENMSKRHVISSEQQLGAVIREAGGDAALVAAATLERVASWEAKRAKQMALREAVQANGAVSVNAYAEAGTPEIVWVTVGKNCPLCDSMDGRTVTPGSDFVEPGGTVTADGTKTLTARRGIAHPPLHPPNCNCMVAAKGV